MALTSTNMLAATFGRPIRGIHNRTYGTLPPARVALTSPL